MLSLHVGDGLRRVEVEAIGNKGLGSLTVLPLLGEESGAADVVSRLKRRTRRGPPAPRAACRRAAGTPEAKTVSTVFPRGADGSSMCAMAVMSSGPSMTPSVSKEPAASSRSSPGVRMVTATGRPSMRISKGASTAI